MLYIISIVLFKELWSQNNSWTKWTSCNQHVISMLKRNEKQQLMFVVWPVCLLKPDPFGKPISHDFLCSAHTAQVQQHLSTASRLSFSHSLLLLSLTSLFLFIYGKQLSGRHKLTVFSPGYFSQNSVLKANWMIAHLLTSKICLFFHSFIPWSSFAKHTAVSAIHLI